MSTIKTLPGRLRAKLDRDKVIAALAAAVALATLVGLTIPQWIEPAVANVKNYVKVNDGAYEATHGRWDIVPIPDANKINAIHQALLPTGKVLLVAGSGNDLDNFKAGTFKSLIYDPATGQSKLIPTPVDLFCSGHAFLPDGKLLVAGGTQNYEVLKQNQTNAGGVLQVSNNSHKDILLPKGTVFKGDKTTELYKTDAPVLVPAAYKNKSDLYQASVRNVYIASEKAGKSYSYGKQSYSVVDAGKLSVSKLNRHLDSVANAVNMDKKEYEGISASYEFNPWTEKYEPVSPMNYARWYPTLTAMTNGMVMAISGLDGAGQILNGQTEIFDPTTKKWIERKDLQRFFPTYPSVFSTAKPNILFSAGPSTGYGPATKGRTPGFWDISDNTFHPVKGLRDPQDLETGNATWLGPVNDQRMVVIGGGGVGESNKATGRIDVIKLDSADPAFTPLANLPQVTRYPNSVTLPTGNLFITNGSTGYRGEHESDILKSYQLDYQSGKLTRMADPEVGRDYHGTALLMGNGQILTAGGDPLYGNATDTKPGTFEQRIEIYTPPYLFNKDGSRATQPALTSNGHPGTIADGQTITLTLKDSSSIAHVRLLHPAAVTHMTDTNQRLVELPMKQSGNKITITLPTNPALTPPGYYMLFLVNARGVPSKADWIQVIHDGTTHSSSAPSTSDLSDMSKMSADDMANMPGM